MSLFDRRPSLWFAVGALLLCLAHMRWGIGVVAFLAPIPMLRGLRLGGSTWLFFAFTIIGWTLAVLKICTDPIPAPFAIAFALPTAVFLGLPYYAWSKVQGSLSGVHGAVFLAAGLVVGEWLQHTFTDFASWGAAAYTQLDDLALLQLASVTGMAGVSFVVYFIAACIEAIWAGRLRTSAGVWLLGLWVALHVAGNARVHTFEQERDTVLSAAITTDATFGGLPLPSDDRRREVKEGLEIRTREAASAGAELIVWTEAAALVLPSEEEAWLTRLQDLAGELRIELVAAYVVPVSVDPLKYENKYAWLTPEGRLDHTYLKNHPVFGEPAIPGVGPVPQRETAFANVSGAICYDYDYPSMGLQRTDVDLVALPSSDWRGIDPVHTRMAGLRAIEAGHSVLRSTRFGLSAGIDPAGRVLGSMSAFDAGADILLVHLPTKGVTTIYGLLGDWFIALAGLLFAGYATVHVRSRPAPSESRAGGRL